ncbi:MAG: hypothetical protein IID42_02780 [Planctomycetes bacterium]|nr:hypothetical protein [Planctomycetota bacterium]
MKTIRVACLLGVMAWVAPASADDIIWDGGGADNNWDTAENWSNDVVPTFFENVFFTSASSKDCVVTQNQVVFDFTMTAGYTGTLLRTGNPILTVSGDMSVEGGTINLFTSQIIVEGNLAVSGGSAIWNNTDITGNVLISGGSVSLNGSHFFGGDYTHTGGTVNTGPFTRFTFSANAAQAFTVGVSGIALQQLTVDGGSSQVLDIIGDITFGGTTQVTVRSGSTTNLDGTMTLNSGTEFRVLDSSTTLNVLDGSVVDAISARSYNNEGFINEIGTGKVLRTATLGFTDSTGAPVGAVPAGTDVFITLFDADENIDGTVFDTAEVTVTSLTTGDVETLTLTEITTQSGEFRNTAGLPTATGTAIPGDGILQQNGTEDLLVSYTDDEDAGDIAGANLVGSPVVWDGGGADNNWDTPENWTDDVVPSFAENVLFDATSSKNCVVTQFQEMLNLTIAAGYTGTISQTGSPTLQINGDLSVDGGRITCDSFNGFLVSGDTSITGGTINWRSTDFTGDVLINGGTVTWERSSHTFRGDYTRAGGTVNTNIDTVFIFVADAPQAFTIGAGGIGLLGLTVRGGSSQVLDITGDITGAGGNFDFRSSSTTNLDGTLTLNSSPFALLDSLTTFNVLDVCV